MYICFFRLQTEEFDFNTGHIEITQAEIVLSTRPEGAVVVYVNKSLSNAVEPTFLLWLFLLLSRYTEQYLQAQQILLLEVKIRLQTKLTGYYALSTFLTFCLAEV